MINNGVRNAEYYRYIDANLEIYNYEALSEPGYIPRSSKNNSNIRKHAFCENTNADTNFTPNLSRYNSEIKTGLELPTNADNCEIRNEPHGDVNFGKMDWYKNVTINTLKNRPIVENNSNNAIVSRKNYINNINLRSLRFGQDRNFECGSNMNIERENLDIGSEFDIQDYEDVEMNESFMYPSSIEKKTKNFQQLNSYLKSGAPLIQIYRPSCKRLLVQSHDEYESDRNETSDVSGLKATSFDENMDTDINQRYNELNNTFEGVDQDNELTGINRGSGTFYYKNGDCEDLIVPSHISKKVENHKDQDSKNYNISITSNGSTMLDCENINENQCEEGGLKDLSETIEDINMRYKLARGSSDTNKASLEAGTGTKVTVLLAKTPIETGSMNPNYQAAETAPSISIEAASTKDHSILAADSKEFSDKQEKKVKIVEKNIKMLREQYEACSVLKVRPAIEPREKIREGEASACHNNNSGSGSIGSKGNANNGNEGVETVPLRVGFIGNLSSGRLGHGIFQRNFGSGANFIFGPRSRMTVSGRNSSVVGASIDGSNNSNSNRNSNSSGNSSRSSYYSNSGINHNESFDIDQFLQLCILSPSNLIK
ncbi:hypothetical protein AYI70_g7122 [Smittium culicis]|uniref:Uncharacterized protein n=1 Tax=Smittium culicis TaxID=133412 RepID=A0A1R1XLY9_9FUNG|nr:hypothetical protein AYI70_g7122 [Smittium culicis]